MILSLIHQYYYPEQSIRVEYPVQMGRTKKRADVVVFGESGRAHLVIEVKQKIDETALEQLKSYLMVTGATYGAAVSGHEFICFKRDTGNNFAELADIPLCNGGADIPGNYTGLTSKSSSVALLRTSLQIEAFEKVDRAHVRMTIQGLSLNLSIADLASYKKLQNRFLSAGVILASEIKQAAWLSFIRELLATTPDSVTPQAPSAPSDAWMARIATYLIDRKSVSMNEILSDCIKIEFTKQDLMLQRRVGRILRGLGWTRRNRRNAAGKQRTVWVSADYRQESD
jgi:hypothetical protein